MMHTRHPVASLLAACLLAGCGSTPKSTEPPRQEINLSEQSAAARPPIVADDQQRAKVHTDLGIAYLRDGRIEVALSEAQLAVDMLGSYAPAHNLLGLIHMSLRQNEQAEGYFRRAVSLAPNNPEIANNYGWFLCQTGKIKESFGYFNQVLRNPLYKTPAVVLNNMGICALMDRDDVNGESYLSRSLKLDPGNLRAYYLLAEVDYRRGLYDEAKDWLAKLHKRIEPTSETIWLLLRIDRKRGDREAELRGASLLRQKFRDSPEYQQLMRGVFD